MIFRLFHSLTLLLVAATAAAQTSQIAPNIQRATVAGVDLLVLKTGVKDVVTLRGSLPAGDAAAKNGNVALATLAGEMLDQGTTRQNKFAIAEQLEAVGATVSFSVDNDMLVIRAKCLSKDVPLVVRLIAEQLRSPAFDPEEFARLKTRLAGAFQRQLESTDARALEAFNQAAYPREHPNRVATVRQFLAALESARLEDVKAFHAKHYGPKGLTLVLVGDVEAANAQNTVQQSFAGWTGGGAVIRSAQPAQPPSDVRQVQTLFMDEKPSVSIVWGQPTGLKHSDPDALPLRVGTAILGSGFTGRLLATIRDKEGLTYGIGARMANDTFNDGEWRIIGTFAPELLDQGIASTQRELQAWHSKGVTARELDERKTNLAGIFKIQLSTTEGAAETILQTVQRGYDLTWIDEYPAKVQALTLEQVNGAIKRHLDPAKMVLVRAGTVPETK
jgi:zinc protease